MSTLNILIVDDSKLMRDLFTKVIAQAMTDVVLDTAENGKVALDKIAKNSYDVITLDLNMPVMNGLEFMKARKKEGIDIPVIIFSSIAHSGASWTIECLELGASDFLLKPMGLKDLQQLSGTLSKLIRLYGRRHAMRTRNAFFTSSSVEKEPIKTPVSSTIRTNTFFNEKKIPTEETGVVVPLREPGRIEIVVIGISTGGPNALREVFAKLSPDISQPIVVVQHMPVGFTAEFASSLNNICPLEVKEAQEGDILKPGRIFIAPGDKHVVVEKRTLASIIRLSDEEKRNGHKPSADVLFESVAKVYANRALGIIMTGMGRDGAVQLAEMRRQGARTFGQDEESCVVYGMPRVAFEMGAVQEQIPLSKVADKINNLCLNS